MANFLEHLYTLSLEFYRSYFLILLQTNAYGIKYFHHKIKIWPIINQLNFLYLNI